MEKYREICEEAVKKVLKDDAEAILVEEVSALDKMDGNCFVQLKINESILISGEGVGLFDAMFVALKQHYLESYFSLGYITIEDFTVEVRPKSGINKSGSDKICTVSVVAKNHRGSYMKITDSSSSLLASAARATSKMVEFFINAEKAFTVLIKALEDARQRNRDDLVVEYTKMMSSIVVVADYSHIFKS